MLAPLSPDFWSVYHCLTKQWYETEYRLVATPERWCRPTMLSLEDIACRHRTKVG